MILLYLLLLKATVTSFSGTGSLPQIRRDFVDTYHFISADQLSEAVLIGRATPGAVGGYVVAVGYLAGGMPGAVLGWLAMTTPALLAIPLLAVVERLMHLPRARGVIDGIVIGGAALLVPTGVTLAVEGLSQLLDLAH